MWQKFQKLFSAENPLILASKSPQRMRILEMLAVPFRFQESNFLETAAAQWTAEETAEKFARGKAEDVFQQYPQALIVGIDTLVISAQGQILGKPKDATDAEKMIQEKSGQTETVISGICLLSAQKKLVRHERATITFRTFDAAEAAYALSLNEWEGKSGAISVEGKSSFLIDSISGNFWNIVGFPLPTFLAMLEEEGGSDQ